MAPATLNSGRRASLGWSEAPPPKGSLDGSDRSTAWVRGARRRNRNARSLSMLSTCSTRTNSFPLPPHVRDPVRAAGLQDEHTGRRPRAPRRLGRRQVPPFQASVNNPLPLHARRGDLVESGATFSDGRRLAVHDGLELSEEPYESACAHDLLVGFGYFKAACLEQGEEYTYEPPQTLSLIHI